MSEIIEAHTGDVRVESEAGKGAFFTVLLPVIVGDSSVPLSEAI